MPKIIYLCAGIDFEGKLCAHWHLVATRRLLLSQEGQLFGLKRPLKWWRDHKVLTGSMMHSVAYLLGENRKGIIAITSVCRFPKYWFLPDMDQLDQTFKDLGAGYYLASVQKARELLLSHLHLY